MSDSPWCSSSSMMSLFLLLLYGFDSPLAGHGYGYDSGGEQGACGRPYRAGKMYGPAPGCDLTRNGFCASAGPAYPWTAVRRFVRENRGLMKRMYGDQPQHVVIKGEVGEEVMERLSGRTRFGRDERFRYDFDQDLDLDLGLDIDVADNEVHTKDDHAFAKSNGRYLKDDVLNTKFVYSEEPAITIRLKDISSAPYFSLLKSRPTTQKLRSSQSTATITPITTVDYNETTTESQDRSTIEAITESSTTATTTTTTTTDQTTTSGESPARTTITGSTVRSTVIGSTTTVGEEDASTSKSDDDKKEGTMLFQDMVDEKTMEGQFQMRGVNACPVKEEVVAPFWANNTRGEVLALLNMYPFEQYVHWEKCTHELRQMHCREGCRCEQQYRLHRLLAYDPGNECRGIFSDWFRFPSCCVCRCYGLPHEFRVTSRSPRREQVERSEWPP